LIQPNHIIVMPFRLVETMSNHQTIRNSVAADTQPSTSLVQTTPSNYKSYQRSWQDLWQSYILLRKHPILVQWDNIMSMCRELQHQHSSGVEQ
jgi:hypothetical protein